MASPEIVAASALKGYISGTREYEPVRLEHSRRVVETGGTTDVGEIKRLKDFPATMSGRLVFVPQDNINTDGIYPG